MCQLCIKDFNTPHRLENSSKNQCYFSMAGMSLSSSCIIIICNQQKAFFFSKSHFSLGEEGSFLFLSYLGKHPCILRHPQPRHQAATTAAQIDQNTFKCSRANPKYTDRFLSLKCCAQTATAHTTTTASRNVMCISTNPATIRKESKPFPSIHYKRLNLSLIYSTY